MNPVTPERVASKVKLSKPQVRLLLSLPHFGVKHVVSYFKPAQALVKLGLAYWNTDDKLALTARGLSEKVWRQRGL